MPKKGLEYCSFRSLIDEWLEYCQAEGLSRQTIEDYFNKAYKFWWWWDKFYAAQVGKHPANVGVLQARAFAAYLREPDDARWGVAIPQNNRRTTNLSPASIASYHLNCVG